MGWWRGGRRYGSSSSSFRSGEVMTRLVTSIVLMCASFTPTSTGINSDPLAVVLHDAQADWGRFPAQGIVFRDLGGCYKGPMQIAYAEALDGDWKPGHYQRGYVILNSQCPWSSGWLSPSGLLMRDYLKVVVRHEVGHLIGLPHSTVPNSIMADGLFEYRSISIHDRKDADRIR